VLSPEAGLHVEFKMIRWILPDAPYSMFSIICSGVTGRFSGAPISSTVANIIACSEIPPLEATRLLLNRLFGLLASFANARRSSLIGRRTLRFYRAPPGQGQRALGDAVYRFGPYIGVTHRSGNAGFTCFLWLAAGWAEISASFGLA